jgi:tRNA modification GTPase
VEREGIRRALQTAQSADLVLELRDLSAGRASAAENVEARERLVIGTKRDLVSSDRQTADCTISTKTGAGLDDLIALLRSRVENATSGPGTLIPNRQRHREYLQRTLSYLDESLEAHAAVELRAESLRLAGDMIGRLTGKIDVEDLLDVIFSEFCIGK